MQFFFTVLFAFTALASDALGAPPTLNKDNKVVIDEGDKKKTITKTAYLIDRLKLTEENDTQSIFISKIKSGNPRDASRLSLCRALIRAEAKNKGYLDFLTENLTHIFRFDSSLRSVISVTNWLMEIFPSHSTDELELISKITALALKGFRTKNFDLIQNALQKKETIYKNLGFIEKLSKIPPQCLFTVYEISASEAGKLDNILQYLDDFIIESHNIHNTNTDENNPYYPYLISDITKNKKSIENISSLARLKNNTETYLKKSQASLRFYENEIFFERVSRAYRNSTTHINEQLKVLSKKLEENGVFPTNGFVGLILNILEKREPDGIITVSEENPKTRYMTDYLGDSSKTKPTRTYEPMTGPISVVSFSKKTHSSFIKGKKLSTPSVPLEYFILLPPNEKIPSLKGLLIHVYGGHQNENPKKDKYSGEASLFDRKLLNQGYAIAYLNLADLVLNTKFQMQMDEPVFEKIREGIHLFIKGIKNKAINKAVDALAEKPIYLMGESFGGITVANFMRKHPTLLSGGISWNGALFAPTKPELNYLDPSHPENLKKITDPLLVLQAWNDNIVSPLGLSMFLDQVKDLKKDNIHPFMIKVGNTTVSRNTKTLYIGHFLPSTPEILDPIIHQVLIFMGNPKSKSPLNGAIDQRRENLIKDLAPLNRGTVGFSSGAISSFNEIFKGLSRKWYEARIREKRSADFDKEWTEYYLPKYLEFTLKFITNTFELPTKQEDRERIAKKMSILLQPHKGYENFKEHNIKTMVSDTYWDGQIHLILLREMKKIGLEDRYTKDAALYGTVVKASVMTSLKNLIKFSAEPSATKLGSLPKNTFATQVALEALARAWCKQHHEALPMLTVFNKEKESLRQWIEGWRQDSRSVVKKVFTPLKNDLNLQRNKDQLRNIKKDLIMQ